MADRRNETLSVFSVSDGRLSLRVTCYSARNAKRTAGKLLGVTPECVRIDGVTDMAGRQLRGQYE